MMETQHPTQLSAQPPVQPIRRMRRRRIAWIVGTLSVLALAACFALWGDSHFVLAQTTLSDGSILELRHLTNDGGNVFDARPGIPSSPALTRWIGHVISPWRVNASNSYTNFPPEQGCTLWISLLDKAKGEPLDFSALGDCILVDERGWPHRSTGATRTAYGGSRLVSEHRQSQIIFQLLQPTLPFPRGQFDEIVLGATFPRMHPQNAQLKLYDIDGKLLGSLPIRIPADPRLLPDPPVSQLPVTISQGDLTATLEDLQLQLLPFEMQQPVNKVALPRYHVVPRVSLGWQGGDAGNWSFGGRSSFEITDSAGNVQTSTNCEFSPFVDWWNFHLKVWPRKESAHREDQFWASSQLKFPASGEAMDVNEERIIDGVRVRIHKFLGPGHHEFTTPAEGSAQAKVWFSNIRPEYTQLATQRGTSMDWVIDAPFPSLVISCTGAGDYRCDFSFFWDGPNPKNPVFLQEDLSEREVFQVVFLDRMVEQATAMHMQAIIRRAFDFEFRVQPPVSKFSWNK